MTVRVVGFDRGAGGGGEAIAGEQYAALAQAAMELARAWASAAPGVEPDAVNYPGFFSARAYAAQAAASAASAAWLRGSGSPAPGLGANGNYYLNQTNGDLWQKSNAGVWELVMNIVGPAGSSGGGSALTIRDEGSSLTTAAASINFTGPGVTATNSGNDVTVAVAGGAIPPFPGKYASIVYGMAMSRWGSSGLESVNGFTFSSSQGLNFYNAPMSNANYRQTIPRSTAQIGAGATGNCGWGFGNSSGNVNAMRVPYTGVGDNGGGKFAFLCGFDSANTAVDTAVEMLMGIKAGPTALPVAGTLLDFNTASWIGFYKRQGSSTMHFGYKPSGTTSITSLHTLSTTWGSDKAYFLEIEITPNGQIVYLLQEIVNATTVNTLCSGTVASVYSVFAAGEVPVLNYFATKNSTSNAIQLWANYMLTMAYPLGIRPSV